MRLLLVINTMETGGAEKLLADSVPLFQQQGIATDVLVLKNSNMPLLEKLRSETYGEVFELGYGSVYNPMHVFKLIGYFKTYDIVHAHLFPSIYWSALAKMMGFLKTKLVYTEHSTNNRRRENFLLSIADKILYKQYSKIVTIADEVDVTLKKHLQFPPDSFKLIPNGIDLATIANAKAYPKTDFFNQEDKILIQVSNFRYPKDQQTVIKALLHLQPDVKLILVGDGPEKSVCEALVKDLQLENRVVFTGVRMDVPALLKTSDVVLLSSHYEGLSLSAIEAMASGRPFVASDAPGLGHFVKGAGIVFEIGNATQLADAIHLLLSDENHYQNTVARCLDRAQQYDIRNMVKGYTEVYRQILNRDSNG